MLSYIHVQTLCTLGEGNTLNVYVFLLESGLFWYVPQSPYINHPLKHKDFTSWVKIEN